MADGYADTASFARFGEGYGLDRAGMAAFVDAYAGDDADDPYASPLRAPDLTGVAPAHVITAEFDVLRDAGEAYARRLVEAGVPTTAHRLLGQTHGSGLLWQTWAPARAWMDEVAATLFGALSSEEPERVVSPLT
jgi:acetyl esterase